MSARQGIGLAIVALAIAASVLVPSRLGNEDDPGRDVRTNGCQRALEPDAEATLCLLNAERRRRGLRPLRSDESLENAARFHALHMLNHDYFAHETPGGVTPHERITRAGYRPARLTGENLAKGDGAAGAAAPIVDGWMRSPGHRANILRRGFEDIGVAVVEGDETVFYVTTFGARR